MAATTNFMGLRVWDQFKDDYDHDQLADNWAKVDEHDHTDGRGVRLTTQSIESEAITTPLLGLESVTGEKIGPGGVKYEEGPVGSRPPAEKKGREYHQTDSGQEGLSKDTGSAWRSILGMKIGQTYSELTPREEATEFEPNTTFRPTFVTTKFSGSNSGEGVVNIICGGVTIATFSIPAKQIIDYTFICPPGVKWKWTKSGEKPAAASSYLFL